MILAQLFHYFHAFCFGYLIQCVGKCLEARNWAPLDYDSERRELRNDLQFKFPLQVKCSIKVYLVMTIIIDRRNCV